MKFIMQPLKLIKHALDTTIEMINKGNKPTAALEKVARELDLNPNYIQRTGEALNVALTYDHFKKNASDKAIDFDIADTVAVTKNIFGDREKSLSQKKAEWFPKVNEEINYNKLLTNPKFKKTAAEITATDAKHESYEITFKGQYKKAQDYLSRLDRELDVLKTDKVANDAYVEGAFFQLVNGFKKEASARLPFHEFESQVFAAHGERSVPYLDLIYKAAGTTDERGARDLQKIYNTFSKEAELFGDFLKAAAAKATFDAELKDANEFIDSQKGQFKQAGYALNPMAQAFDKATCAKLAEELDDMEKEAAEGRSNIVDLITKFHDTMTGKDAPKPVFQNTDGDNKERMRILQELIMTDPILAKQDPRKIVQAYQQILRLAPHLSKEKGVVSAQLRGMLAGQALHPTDANQLVEANTNMMKQHQLLKQTDGGSDRGGKK